MYTSDQGAGAPWWSPLLLAITLVMAAASSIFLPEAMAQERTLGAQAYDAAVPSASGQPVADLAPGEARVARYSTTSITPAPAARQPLAVVATVNFPRGHIATVGDAIQHLLVRTGYRLDTAQLSQRATAVLAMPLPDAQRRLGPYRVDQMLGVLLGEPWVLSVDNASRSITYAAPGEPLPSIAPQVVPTPAAAASSTGRTPT